VVSVHFLEKWRHFVSPKRHCDLGLGLELGLGLRLSLELGLVEIRFRLNLFSSKCSRSNAFVLATMYFFYLWLYNINSLAVCHGCDLCDQDWSWMIETILTVFCVNIAVKRRVWLNIPTAKRRYSISHDEFPLLLLLWLLLLRLKSRLQLAKSIKFKNFTVVLIKLTHFYVLLWLGHSEVLWRNSLLIY